MRIVEQYATDQSYQQTILTQSCFIYVVANLFSIVINALFAKSEFVNLLKLTWVDESPLEKYPS